MVSGSNSTEGEPEEIHELPLWYAIVVLSELWAVHIPICAAVEPSMGLYTVWGTP